MQKYCTNCGKELQEGQDLCLGCGKVINNKKNNTSLKKTNSLAIAGFVVSIISLVFFWFPFAFIVSIVSLVLSIVGTVKSKLLNGKGFAIGGIVISVVAFILSAMFSFIYFLAAIFGIEWAVAQEECVDMYGTSYEAREGYEIPGLDDDDYSYYCCPINSVNSYRECKKLNR